MTKEINCARNIDMESSEFLRAAIRHGIGRIYKNPSELARKAGVNQGNLSNFLKEEGTPGRRENVTFEFAWKVLGVLGLQPTLDDINHVSTDKKQSKPTEEKPKDVNQKSPSEKDKIIEQLKAENIELKGRLVQCEKMHTALIEALGKRINQEDSDVPLDGLGEPPVNIIQRKPTKNTTT